VRLPDPPFLLVTDRQQARLPLADVVTAALAAGCRWGSLREKDLSNDEQVGVARSLLRIARRHGARLSLHGDAELAKASGIDGVHLPAGSDPAAARKLLGQDKLIGVSIHTVTEAEAIDPVAVDYAIAGRRSRPRASPAMDRRSAARAWPRSPARRACRCWRSAGSTPRGRRRCWRPARSGSRSWAASCARPIPAGR